MRFDEVVAQRPGNPPADAQDRIHWCLPTTHAVETAADALLIVKLTVALITAGWTQDHGARPQETRRDVTGPAAGNAFRSYRTPAGIGTRGQSTDRISSLPPPRLPAP